MKFPAWFPTPGSWMSAILLTLLMGAIGIVIKLINEPVAQFVRQNLSSRLCWTLAALSILIPIVVIAFAHHLLHVYLDRFFPDSLSPEMGRTEGFFPGLMSWWEGMYGWLVIFISTTVTIAIITAFFPFDSSEYAFLYYMQMLFAWDEPKHLLSAPVIGRTIAAAYLYQFEYLVHRRVKEDRGGKGSRGSKPHL